MNRPPMKRILCLLMAMPLSVAVWAAPPNTLSGEVLACRDIVPDAARLACFDRMAATVAPARVSSAPSSSKPAAPAAKDALDPKRTFGLSQAAIAKQEESAAGGGPKELSHITARVVRIQQSPQGGEIFELDNGQVWELSDPDGTDVTAKVGDSVEISRGFLGSYWLATRYQRFNVVRRR